MYYIQTNSTSKTVTFSPRISLVFIKVYLRLGLTVISIILGSSVADLGIRDMNALEADISTVLLNTASKLPLSASHLNSLELI